MNPILSAILASLIGMTILVGTNTLSVDDILASAQNAANQANFHQYQTALEMYYDDYGIYPAAANAEELADTLKDSGYIEINESPIPGQFTYQVDSNGQHYSLAKAD
jgi:hypothetical protein